MKTEVLPPQKIVKARQDIRRVLNRYSLTLPEVIGAGKSDKNADEKIWKDISKDYEKVQENIFAKIYPALWKKVKKG